MYSDKSNAAKFSTAAIWLVLARVASLPKVLRNRNSAYAGNTMLGFLPKVSISLALLPLLIG
jgi:hypothetical protein